MQFTVPQASLNQQLNIVAGAIHARPSHPILANILVKAKNNTLELTGYNLNIAIISNLECEIQKEGEFTIPLVLFKNIISKLDKEDINITLESQNDTIHIKTQTGNFKIQGQPTEQYPTLPEFEVKNNLILPVEQFKKGLAATLFAASTEETKQVLTGVSIIKKETNLEFAATDSHRLGVTKFEVSENIENFNVVVPNSALKEVLKLLNTVKSENIEIDIDDNKYIVFTLDKHKIISRLLTNNFPAYNNLIPKSFTTSVIVDKKLFLNRIEIINVVADDKNHLIKFLFENNILTIRDSQETAKETLSYEGQGSKEIGFNSKYLLDGLKAIPGDNVVINANLPNQPVVFTPEDTSSTYLVMPIEIIR